MKRVLITLVLMAASAGFAVVVYGAFIASHQATGNINTAVTATEALYICQPSGTTVSPQCPIDTNGADEFIFPGDEDLVAGRVAWQKIRVTNVGTEPWDILSLDRIWTEISDVSGLCDILPEGVIREQTDTIPDPDAAGGPGPGITVLGQLLGGSDGPRPEPVEGVTYTDSLNDNHSSVADSVTYLQSSGVRRTVHVEPGGYEDLLLGLRLPVDAPDDCLNVVWELRTVWNVQAHVSP